MSFLKDETPKIDKKTWLNNIKSDWTEGSLAMNIINNESKTQFINHLTAANNWEWFRILMLCPPSSFKIEWLEEIVKTGLPLDKTWIKMDTGKQTTVFDLHDIVEGGIEDNLSKLFEDIYQIYETLFLKQQVQPVIDIFTDYIEDNKWSELTIILMSHVLGPLNKTCPLFHYMVLMNRYDILRAFLNGATTLHKEIVKKHKNINFQKSWVNLKNHDGSSILHLVCEQNKSTWISYFLSVDADPLLEDFNKLTPFHVQTNQNKCSMLFNSLERENKDRWKSENMTYFLIYATQKNDTELLRWLLSIGGNPNTSDLVSICIKNDYEECLSVLMEYGADPNEIDLPKNIGLIESKIHVESGGLLFSNNIIGLLHDKYTPIELCIISTLYNQVLNIQIKEKIIQQYLDSMETKNLIKTFLNQKLNIKAKNKKTIEMQNIVKNVIHMCE